MADPRTPTHTTSDDLSCADCGDLEDPMCDRCFGEFATAAIKRLTFERDEARAAVDAARADERAKCEAEFGGDTLDIALTLARASERSRIVAGHHQAIKLLEYALHLRIYGECAPGGNETWREFDRRCEAFLQARIERGEFDDVAASND